MRSRMGLSAAVAAVAAATFLVMGLYMATLVIARTGYGGVAQQRAIQELNRRANEKLEIYISPDSTEMNPGAEIVFINKWGDTSYVDYIAVLDRNGHIMLELRGEDVPSEVRALPPGSAAAVKPSALGLEKAYDGDYWRMKGEVSRVIVHTESGNVFSSTYGRPPAESALSHVETTLTSTEYTTEWETKWVTRTRTRTTTITISR